jgi:hypothetical protein
MLVRYVRALEVAFPAPDVTNEDAVDPDMAGQGLEAALLLLDVMMGLPANPHDAQQAKLGERLGSTCPEPPLFGPLSDIAMGLGAATRH